MRAPFLPDARSYRRSSEPAEKEIALTEQDNSLMLNYCTDKLFTFVQ
jgi:hypothetical protein